VSLPVRLIDYGLRDYGTAKWEGGDPNCDHLGKLVPSRAGFNKRYFGKPSSEGNKQDALHEPMGEICAKCGAVRIDQQIGLEQTPAEYVNDIVQVFREVWRILRDDGTVWLNLGDSYNGSGGAGGDYIEGGLKEGQPKYPGRHINNLKLKDLIGIPWMVAFALRDDGWYLRQDIIWHKPNPMPESVKDRCTKAHEYIFLLSKSPRYYYDYEAVLEPVSDKSLKRAEYGWDCDRPSTKNASLGGDGIHTEKMGERFVNPAGRNRRSVWTIPTSPYRGAHYATFPPKLIEPMILAGCPAGGIVLDPFVGSGTTIMVANQLGRRGIGLDLSFKYLHEDAKKRIATVQPIMIS
jgi:site-specific DNA-methyltransferase (adenine-specific)